MSTLTWGEFCGLNGKESPTAQEAAAIDAYLAYRYDLNEKIAAGTIIDEATAEKIRAKGENICQAELVALNWFDHGLPGSAKTKKASKYNSNVPENQRPEKDRKPTQKDFQALMAKMDELIEALNAP